MLEHYDRSAKKINNSEIAVEMAFEEKIKNCGIIIETPSGHSRIGGVF